MAQWRASRINYAERIWSQARELKGLRAPAVFENYAHAAYKCYVFVEPQQLKADWNRDRVLSEISALGVPCFSGSCSEVYLEKAFDDTGWRPEVRLAIAKELG